MFCWNILINFNSSSIELNIFYNFILILKVFGFIVSFLKVFKNNLMLPDCAISFIVLILSCWTSMIRNWNLKRILRHFFELPCLRDEWKIYWAIDTLCTFSSVLFLSFITYIGFMCLKRKNIWNVNNLIFPKHFRNGSSHFTASFFFFIPRSTEFTWQTRNNTLSRKPHFLS